MGKRRLNNYTSSELKELMFGYPERDEHSERSYARLSLYIDTLKHHKHQLMNDAEECLCPEEAQAVIESVIDIIGKSCCPDIREDLIVDDCNFEEWVEQHPKEVGYEEWEKYIYQVCEKMDFNIEVDSRVYGEAGNLREIDDGRQSPKVGAQSERGVGFAVDTSNYEKLCEITYDVKEYSDICTIDFDREVNTIECKISYETLVDHDLCDLTFDEYVTLIKCGMTANFIGKVYDCGLQITYDEENACPALTYKNEIYEPICGDGVDGELVEEIWTTINTE